MVLSAKYLTIRRKLSTMVTYRFGGTHMKRTIAIALGSALLFASLCLGGCTETGPSSPATVFRPHDLEKIQRLVRDFDHYTVRRRHDEQFVSVSEYKVTPECIAYLDADSVQQYIVYNGGDSYRLTQTESGYDRTPYTEAYSAVIAEAYNYFTFEEADWEYDNSTETYTNELIPNASVRIRDTIVSLQLKSYSIELYNFGATSVEIPRG